MNKIPNNEMNERLFFRTHPEFVDKDKYKLFQRRIIYLSEQTESLIHYVKQNGFNSDLSEINPMKWYKFVSQVVVYIENMKGLTNGEEKLELLLGYISVIIINLIPVPNDMKIILINQIHEVIPEIVEGLIYVSKKLHKYKFRLYKKLKEQFKCCINRKKNKPSINLDQRIEDVSTTMVR
jgi:hypothetical protein